MPNLPPSVFQTVKRERRGGGEERKEGGEGEEGEERRREGGTGSGTFFGAGAGGRTLFSLI